VGWPVDGPQRTFDNWPGMDKGVQGPELIGRMRKHAERFENQKLFSDHV